MTSKAKKNKISNEAYSPQDLRDDSNQLLDDILEIGKDMEHFNAS